MKYEIIPMINGVKRSVLFDMSLSVPIFLAHRRIIAKGNTEVKIIDINSSVKKLLLGFFQVNIKQIIKNKGMQIIGGLVNVEIILAILYLSMILLYFF